MALSNDASLFVTVEREGAIVIWELPSGRRLQAFGFPGNYVGPLEISTNGGRIATAAETDFVSIYNIATGSHTRLRTGFSPFDVAFSPRGDWIASWAWGSHSPTVLDIASRQSSTPDAQGRNSRIEAAVFSPDGRLLATGASDGAIVFWNLETMELVTEIDGARPVWARSHSLPTRECLFPAVMITRCVSGTLLQGRSSRRSKVTQTPSARSVFQAMVRSWQPAPPRMMAYRRFSSGVRCRTSKPAIREKAGHITGGPENFQNPR